MEDSTRLVELLTTALGSGIAALLRDEQISEVRLNSDGSVWGNRLGQGKFQAEDTISPENARRAIYAVAYGVGDICNEIRPSISAELPLTGERFQGIIPPLSKSPVFVIRKKAVRIFTLEDLVHQGVLSEHGLRELRAVVLARKNILVVGGTDSGKTTFKRIYEIDPLECPKCKAQMRIIAFIQDAHSIKDIMKAQGIPDFQAPPPIPKFIDTVEAIDEIPSYDSFEPSPDDF